MLLYSRLLLPLFPLAVGTAAGFIQPIGLLIGVLFVALVFASNRLPAWLWYALVLVASLLLAAHRLPGFAPWVLGREQISSDAAPYLLRLSWDKLLVGCTLLAWWIGAAPTRCTRLPMLAVAVCLATLIIVPGLALLMGLVSWQPKWPEIFWRWLIINLGVAVLAEELFFRGLLQPRLIAWLGAWPGILCGALLFGAVHIPFSPSFAVVAAIAGVGYGLAFHLSGRLSVAIALHGLVNVLHITLLSYPLRIG